MRKPERLEAALAAPPLRARVGRMGRHTARPVGWVLLLALAESLEKEVQVDREKEALLIRPFAFTLSLNISLHKSQISKSILPIE